MLVRVHIPCQQGPQYLLPTIWRTNNLSIWICLYNKKPDYLQIRPFSSAYYCHHKGCAVKLTQFQSYSLQGITLGWSDIANKIEIYHPSSKQLYISAIFKIDELKKTNSLFNLKYDVFFRVSYLCPMGSMGWQQNYQDSYIYYW